MMTADEKWKILKDDIELAVEEGIERGFNNHPENPDGGRFLAYQYLLDKMNRLDGEA